MDSFSYLWVLLSIVLGLAITQVLQGLRGLILTRAWVKLYWPTLIWTGLALLLPLQGWWASFGLRQRVHWTFLGFFVVLLQAISTYMVAALVLPDVIGEATIDLREHYFAHRVWFFGALSASVGFSAVKEFILAGHLPEGENGLFHALFGLAALAGLIIRREWLHQVLTPVMGLLFLLYIGLLFARL